MQVDSPLAEQSAEFREQQSQAGTSCISLGLRAAEVQSRRGVHASWPPSPSLPSTYSFRTQCPSGAVSASVGRYVSPITHGRCRISACLVLPGLCWGLLGSPSSMHGSGSPLVLWPWTKRYLLSSMVTRQVSGSPCVFGRLPV